MALRTLKLVDLKTPQHGNHTVKIAPGSGPHAGRLVCMDCRSSKQLPLFITWLSRQQIYMLQRAGTGYLIKGYK